MSSDDDRTALIARIWDVATKMSVPVVAAFGAAVIAHEVRIARMETSLFTEADALRLQQQLRDAMPPEWVRKLLDRISADLTSLRDGQQRLSERIKELELKVTK